MVYELIEHEGRFGLITGFYGYSGDNGPANKAQIIGTLILLGVYSGEEYLCIAQNGDEFYTVTIAYLTTEYEGTLSINDHESLAFEWINKNNMPSNFSGSCRNNV